MRKWGIVSTSSARPKEVGRVGAGVSEPREEHRDEQRDEKEGARGVEARMPLPVPGRGEAECDAGRVAWGGYVCTGNSCTPNDSNASRVALHLRCACFTHFLCALV